MVSLPKFTKRAAEQIARLEAEGRSHVPPGNYLSFIGWENEVEPGSSRAPLFQRTISSRMPTACRMNSRSHAMA